jgi:hypothetical protein
LAVVAIAAGGLVAAVLPSSADVSTQSPSVAAVRVESPATLVARGAAVRATITVVCQPGAQAFLSLEITENAGGKIARGADSTQVPSCTGDFQQVSFSIASETVPFRRGTAFADANLFVSGSPGNSAEDQREITITRSTGLE